MKQGNSIEVKQIKKRFKVYYDKGKSLKEKFLFQKRNRYEERWVLKGVSFEVKKGEAVGLIGKNGCGKSTTLKILTRIMFPTEGSVELQGRVSSLIELGAGFHPDMSGRENIYTNASIFGLSHREIDRRLEDIIRFSELEEFIDNPVRTYSSGMYMRLAFAVAINVDADILLIDEILAVGDVSFQAKCFEKLKEIKAKGTTIVIVSHSMEQIEEICDRSIWIEDGFIKEEGLPKDIGRHYITSMEERRLQKKAEELRQSIEFMKKETISEDALPVFYNGDAVRWGNQTCIFTGVALLDKDNKEQMVFSNDESLKVVVGYLPKKDISNLDFHVDLYREDGVHCFGVSSLKENIELQAEVGLQKTVEFELTSINLLSGRYFMEIGLYENGKEGTDVISKVREIQIQSERPEWGLLSVEHEWNCVD